MKIAFLFSGQGAQYPGMMSDIADRFDEAKEVFAIADTSLGRSVSQLCFNGTQEELNITHNTQPCVLAADLAAFAGILSHDIKPDVVAGFSLGEYAALVASGVISIKDVFPIIQKRADYMQEAVPVGEGAMAAVMKASSEEVEKLCEEARGYVVPANYNSPGQIVVSGENDAVNELLELAKIKKIRAMKLAVSAPFHCELMAPAAHKLEKELTDINLNNPEIPIYMNVDALPEKEKSCILDKLVLQAKSPVRWEKTLRNMYCDGVNTFVELGPGRTLSGFVKKTFKGVDGINCFNVTDMESLLETVLAIKGLDKEL